MNHNKSYRKLGRRADHRKAMLKNLTISLLSAEKIETTVTRAKELRKFAERMITFGKKNTLASRRNAFAFLRNEEVVAKIFNELAPKYAERNDFAATSSAARRVAIFGSVRLRAASNNQRRAKAFARSGATSIGT